MWLRDRQLLTGFPSCAFSSQVNQAAEVIYGLVDPNANLIFGAVVDDNMQGAVSVASPDAQIHVRKLLERY
jgi:cell division GTPase FtsZ